MALRGEDNTPCNDSALPASAVGYLDLVRIPRPFSAMNLCLFIRLYLALFLLPAFAAAQSPGSGASNLQVFFDGSRGFGGVTYDTVGYKFSVGNSPIAISKVGILDNLDDGLFGPNRVGLWDAQGTLILDVQVPGGTVAPLADHYRWVTLPSPIILAANSVYTAGAICVGGWAESRFNGSAQMAGSGVSLIGLVRNNSQTGVFSMPSDGFSAGKAFIGANFAYDTVPAFVSGPATASG